MKNWHYIILGLAFMLAAGMGCNRPLADFSYVVEKPEVPAKVAFENSSQNATTYAWNFGDSIVSHDVNPEHVYWMSGDYTIELTASDGKKTRTAKRNITVEPPEKCLIRLSTSYGDMIIELFDETPLHRDNFVKLVEQDFYDGLLFHRVIEGFMIQGGDPDSKNAPSRARLGSGGPGYQVPAEFADSLLHVKGAIAAARLPDNMNPEKASSGSQFYIVHGIEVTDEYLDQIQSYRDIQYTPDQRDEYKRMGGYPGLDFEYTVFGKVIEGLHVVDSIAQVQTAGGDRPLEDIQMTMKVIR